MGLFGGKKEETKPAPTDPVEPTPPAPTPPNNPADLAGAIVQAMVNAGIVGTRQQPQPDVPNDDDDPPDPKQDARFQRMINQSMTSMMPYAESFETAVPALIRSQVVQTLTPGQQMIYTKYKGEVDEIMSRNLRGQPAAQVNPDTHRKAINMILGAHSDEIESLSLQHATAADVPHLVPPSSGVVPATPEPQLSDMDRTMVQQYAFGARTAEEWTPQTYDYYKSIPKGYLADMIRHHKAQQQPKQQS